MRQLSCIFISFTFTFFALSSFASQPPVKLSNSGICHDESSAFYSRTKDYIVFQSIEACLSSGGRLPKGYAKSNVTTKGSTNGAYDRSEWKHWSDSDSDCQDTRAEVLIKQSLTSVIFDSEKSCRVAKGMWKDPYSSKTFIDDNDLDIDHIVPLGFMHARGGASWSRERKEQFANDPQNLIAVDKSLNRQKGAAGPTEWMPPNHAYRCEYLARFDAIMKKYQANYYPSEQRVINRMFKACNG